jgi:hypothetical protein
VVAKRIHTDDRGEAIAVKTYREFSIDYTLGVVPLMGPVDVGAYQTTIGCRRVSSQINVSWVEDARAGGRR